MSVKISKAPHHANSARKLKHTAITNRVIETCHWNCGYCTCTDLDIDLPLILYDGKLEKDTAMTNKGILELSLLMPFTKWGKGNSPTVDSLVQITRKPFHGGSPRAKYSGRRKLHHWALFMTQHTLREQEKNSPYGKSKFIHSILNAI